MISIVVPVFNEEESLRHLYKELNSLISKNSKNYELIFVDDGSLDTSLNILKAFSKENSRVRIFSFRKNQGKAEALTFGFYKAKGDYIVTVDADLQDKPSEIPKLLRRAKEGFDVVSGWRKNRKDSSFKVISSKFFNSLARLFWGLKLHDYNCGLKVYSRDAAKSLHLYGGLHRFIPLLAYQQGFIVSEVAVLHDKRRHGESKYGISKIWTDLPDMFTMLFLSKYGTRPLHFFGIVGFTFFIAGVIILGYLGFIKLTQGFLGSRPILFLAMILVLSGLQVFFTGFLADLFLNIYRGSTEKINNNSALLLKYSSEEI